MFEAIIDRAVCGWADGGVIAEEDKDIYVYGLGLVLFSALNLLAIFITAAITGKVLESLLLVSVTIPLQMLGGGYHARTHLNCFLIMYVGWWIVMWLAPLISFFVSIAVVTSSVTVVFWLAPVANENVPMSEGQRKKMKGIVRIFAVIIAAAAIILSEAFFGTQIIGGLITAGLGSVAISMLANKIRILC